MENQEHPFVFEDGDVRAKAKYGGRIITFKLSSHALCFASPVWKKFVFPPLFLPSSLRNQEELNAKKACTVPEEPFPDIELDFTEDDPEALLILLQIAHLKFSNIPAKLSYDVLYNISILCNQYDCRRLVKPWIQDWLKNESTEAYLPHKEGWLWIAYYFGREDICYHMIKTMALRLTIGNDGKRMLMDGPVDREYLTFDDKRYPLHLEGSPLPPEITDVIIHLRGDIIYSLITFTADVMEGLLNSSKLSPCQELCPLAMYGLMSKRLSEHDLWPLPRTKNYNLAPFLLHESIVRALNLSSVIQKPMAKLHTGSCLFMDDWKQALLLKSEYAIRECDVDWKGGETGGNWFQEYIDRAAEEIGDSECPNDSVSGGAQHKFIGELLDFC
ncbi:hypothetical protein BOTCAL_0356g00160 [Botryotinia calthae]|uniref:BTB domain-containing protein n=1 Tax=Botryotinia calthae TaxID=38488 RepID=A0A4Y8CSA2_9HELO|nr:hypothetical protein BOTCAL_0356g00160 [Botryotinia calthae]